MTQSRQGLTIPGRVTNLEQARERHGAKADQMVRLLSVGDPLADAVIVELDTLGKEARHVLNAGLADGLESLTECPPAIAALLKQIEFVPEWVDPEMLRRGEVARLSIPRIWFGLSAITSALVHTYSSPAIARLLTQTGRLTTMAPRRLAETGMWTVMATVPGGLLRGAPGYQATAQVRLLHARIRSGALRRGWDATEWGTPISQVDVTRTWLDFTLTNLNAVAVLGIEMTEPEQNAMYRYWHYVAYLLGLEDDSFYRGVGDNDSARELSNLLDLTIGAPTDDSRALTAAMINATVESLVSVPKPLMSRAEYTGIIHGVLRLTFGDDLADQLGIPSSVASPFISLIALANRQARRWQTFSPESTAKAIEENLAVVRAGIESSSMRGGPIFQQHAQTGAVGD